MDSTSLLQFSLFFVSRYYTCIMASFSLVMVIQSSFCKWYFTIDHKLSGLRSGEFPGHYETLTVCFVKNFFTFCDACLGARSYWDISPPLGKTSHVCNDLLLDHIHVFVWVEHPIYRNKWSHASEAKQPHDIFFGGGLEKARAKLLTIFDHDISIVLSLHPKKWYSSQNKTFFQTCADQGLNLSAHANIFQIIFCFFLDFRPASISRWLTLQNLMMS